MITAKRKIHLTLLSFGILCILLVGFGVMPIVKQIQKGSQDLALKKATLDLLKNQILNLKEFRENYELLEQDLNKIDDSFIDPEAPIDFIEFLESEAQNANLEMMISPFSFPPQKDDPWQSTGFRVNLGGSFSDCLRFLERLEQSPWLIELSQLDVERMAEKSPRPRGFEALGTGDVLTTLTLKAFSSVHSSER